MVYEMVHLQGKYQVQFTQAKVTKFVDYYRVQQSSFLPRTEEERRVESYTIGGSDADMAARLGLTRKSFTAWRVSRNLPANGRSGKRFGRALGTNYEGEGLQCVR